MPKEKISEDRRKYLRKILIKKLSVIFTQIGIVVLFIALWEFLANKEIIDSFITSKPSEILKTFINLSSNDLWMHLRVTCTETIIGFGAGILLGVFIAILLWWSDFLSKVAEPFLVVLNSLPKVALGPIIIVWVGARNKCNNCNGHCNFFSCNYNGNSKWIFRYRQRKNKNGTNF